MAESAQHSRPSNIDQFCLMVEELYSCSCAEWGPPLVPFITTSSNWESQSFGRLQGRLSVYVNSLTIDLFVIAICSDNMCRDDLSTLDSPMSDDSDESVGFRMGRASEVPAFLPVSTLESVSVTPTSPVSPRRKEHFPPYIPTYSSALSSRQQTPPPYTPSLPLPCAQNRVKGTDAEGRLPPSPTTDPCQSADLRRAALLRSLQIRSQSPIRPASSTVAPEKGAEKGVVPEGLEEGGDQSSSSPSVYPSEHTGCNCEDIGVTSTTIFPPISTRAATRVRSLLLDEPVVAATMALSSTLPQSIIQDTDSATGAQESRFEHKSSQPKSLLRGCSKLARAMSSDVIVSDAESKPLRRPSGVMEKSSCKRAKPL